MIHAALHPGVRRFQWPRGRLWACALALGLFGLAAAGSAQTAPARALPAVVVWDFDNQSAASMPPREKTDFLRRSLSENLMATLLQVPGLAVVERLRLMDLLSEQKLSSGDLADDDARLRLGRIIGAARMVFGGFFVLGDEVQVNVRLVDTATTRVLFSEELTVALADVMGATAALNRQLARAVAGPAAAQGTGQGFATDLWRRYDQALALSDAGRFEEAVTQLQQLLAQARDFTPAERQLVALLERMARR